MDIVENKNVYTSTKVKLVVLNKIICLLLKYYFHIIKKLYIDLVN